MTTAVETASSYLRRILDREAVDLSAESPLRRLGPRVRDIATAWAGRHLVELYPVGAFQKGTANRSGVGIDFLASLHPDARFSPREIYESLYHSLQKMEMRPVARPVSIGIRIGRVMVDIIPGRRDNPHTEEHWLYSAAQGKGFVTNPSQHILETIKAGRREETRLLKLWRDRNGLDFPSYYLERTVVSALRDRPGDLADAVWALFAYLETHFVARSVLDPANAHNVLSDELDFRAKARIRMAAKVTRDARSWQDIFG